MKGIEGKAVSQAEASPELVASVIILNERNQVLLIKQKKWADTYSPFIGGHVKVGEKVLDALKREIWEEVGLEIEESKFTFFNYDEWIVKPPEYDREAHLVFLNFLCMTTEEEVVLNTTEEIQEAIWVKIEEAIPLVVPKNRPALEKLRQIVNENSAELAGWAV